MIVIEKRKGEFQLVNKTDSEFRIRFWLSYTNSSGVPQSGYFRYNSTFAFPQAGIIRLEQAATIANTTSAASGLFPPYDVFTTIYFGDTNTPQRLLPVSSVVQPIGIFNLANIANAVMLTSKIHYKQLGYVVGKQISRIEFSLDRNIPNGETISYMADFTFSAR